MELKTDDTKEKKYKSFEETFGLCAFSLAVGFLYPNRNTAIKRAVIISVIITFNGGQLFWFITYTFKCLYTLDIYNFARNMTLAVVLVLFFIKTYYVIYATQKFAPLLDKMSADLIEANDLEEEYQQVYDEHIKEAKKGEISWLFIPVVLSAQFPIYAGILMSIESIKTDDYTRLMVHDMELLFVEDIQSETPFFQCMFAYNCVQCIVLVPNYCGFDGSFCIATTHLRLKLKLMSLKVQKAFRSSRDRFELRAKIREAIGDHQRALDFHVQIQEVYGPWLFAIFMLTSFMISFNLYQIHLLKRIDPKYTLFGLVGVLHIFLPCHYASSLTEVGLEIPDELYCVPWEKWADPVVTKLLIFMICRSQKNIIVTGNGIVVFNMDLFKSILQTSYSFFTLITATFPKMKTKLKTEDPPEKKYNDFNGTYTLCAFALAIALLYPNRKTALKRCVLMTIIITFNGGQLFWFWAYSYKCIATLDLNNFTRNMALGVILILFFIKTYYVIYATQRFATLLGMISDDLNKANSLDKEYQSLYDVHIKQGKVGEIVWLIIPIILSAQFPLNAAVMMSYESIQTDDYVKRMVHDMDLLFVEDIQSETPFFQCMFAYNCIQAVVLVPNYCGFDSAFCIATTHLRLKLRLIVLKVQKAFKHSRNRYELREKVREAIRDHQDALDYYVHLQSVFGTWLFAIFALTSMLISFVLYQIHLLQRFDPKYTTFGLMGVLHIFLPCYYASTLTEVGDQTADDLYCVPWEEWADPVVTKLLIFMICRSQKNLMLTGNGVVVYNMELFKSILQTSYSFFTLITA
ncbi:uncharacterized protein LOC142987855 [Anticarsia gemmatalis]|uniref:uncharacterized protein LOC142987855 n=1 Tax=Anticarsia gemmatalis TaxID=129554 RepID=UPI003F75D691